MAKIYFSVKMLWSNEQLHFCVACFDIRGSGSGTAHLILSLSPSGVYMSVLFIPAFQIHVIETVQSL